MGKYFWVTLLIDCIPFLTAETVLFSSEPTYELLQCLQELATDTSLPNKQQLLLEEHEQRLRLGLAKNLALALTVGGTLLRPELQLVTKHFKRLTKHPVISLSLPVFTTWIYLTNIGEKYV